jgi:hypothetical protein
VAVVIADIIPPKPGHGVTVLSPIEFTMMAIVIVLAISLGAKFVQMVLSERQRRADRARRQQEEQAQMMRDTGRITARSRRRASSADVMLQLAVGAAGILAVAALKNNKGGASQKVRVPGKPCTHCGTPVAIGAFHCEACGAPAPEDNR